MYIEIKKLSKVIKKVTVLHDIDAKFNSGIIYGLKGKNGCGKTMLMRTISGLILKTSGEIIINDKKLGKDISFPESIGVLIENPSFLDEYTGFKNLKLIASIKGEIDDNQIKEYMKKVGLDPEDKRKYKKYSLGMKQKLGIACAVMEEPDIVILDEPINALDEKGVESVREILMDLKKKGKIIIIACHDKEELYYLSDEIYVIEEGTIINHFKVGDKNE